MKVHYDFACKQSVGSDWKGCKRQHWTLPDIRQKSESFLW